MEGSGDVLRVEGLTKRFGSTLAVDQLSFTLRESEILTLLGPSGCGKTTTLMTIAGFEAPDSGRIVFKGRDITRHAPEKREIGVVFQDYALFPHRTVLENVMFPLRMRGISRSEARDQAMDTLATVKLEKPGAYPGQLSGGQQQRVALARALVFEPSLLLMDEPLAALDRRLRQELQFELRELQARLGTPVIFVTHDQEEALVLSDRIGVMNTGRFEQIDTPIELYDNPATLFVANFLGENNRSRATLVRQTGNLVEISLEGTEITTRVRQRGDIHEKQLFFLLRPEHVRIHPTKPEASSDIEITPASVVDVAFIGNHRRVVVRIGEEIMWTALMTPEDHGSAYVEEGKDVYISWEIGEPRLLPADRTTVLQ